MRQRFYFDGKLSKTTKPTTVETLRKWLDNIERDWTKRGLLPLTAAGEFDVNGCHESTRISPDELTITTSGGHKLRWINVN